MKISDFITVFRLIVLAGTLLSISACTPVKGYEGPELPEEQIALVKTKYEGGDAVDFYQRAVDGIAFKNSGIQVLPGKHSFKLSIDVNEEPYDCEGYGKLDYYSYQSCQQKYYQDKGPPCDCYDYLSIYKKCWYRAHGGSCQGTFHTRAGQKYEIIVNGVADTANVMVKEVGNYEPAGDGDCNVGAGRTESREDYQGTGRSTAYSNGVYSCD
ncbi:hypothetical protein JNK13_09450 [bacterium]|nr:hypothetical protein [bacterium]